MVLHGAKIYHDGVSLERGDEEKVQKIINVVKMISPRSDISLRFVKNQRVFEVLLWGKVSGIPIGVYKRGISVAQVLDSLYDKVKKECFKVLKASQKSHFSEPMEMVS